jgi:hypothetical protein
MYNEMRATHDVVLEMSGKLDTALTGGRDHETRIRSLERKIWAFAGAATVLGGAAGIAASLIGGHS